MPSSVATDIPRASRLFHALSDETRLQLVHLLLHGERCVCELTDALGAMQSRLSFHLRTLKDAGLVTDRREGRWVYYSLNADAVEEIGELVGSLKPTRKAWERTGKCCG